MIGLVRNEDRRMNANRLSLLERKPATARAIFWAIVVATINFGIWALSTHAATLAPTATVADGDVASSLYVER